MWDRVHGKARHGVGMDMGKGKGMAAQHSLAGPEDPETRETGRGGRAGARERESENESA